VLLLGLSAALMLRRAPSALAGKGGGAVAGHTLREAMRTPAFRWMYLMAVAASPGMFIPFAHVSAAARDPGVADARAVGLVGLIGIGSLVGRFVIGALADRAGRPLTLALAQASLGLSYLLWAAADGYLAMAVFSLWLGLSYGGIVSLMPALCMDLFGARHSYGPVIWGCLALSVLASVAAWQLVGARVAARSNATTATTATTTTTATTPP